MKELTEWYAGLSMSSVQSNYVGNSRRQKRPTNFLQTLLLLMVMITVGGGMSWGQTLLPTTRYSLSDVGTNPFALVNLSDGKALYCKDSHNTQYSTYTDAFVESNRGYVFVLEQPQNGSYESNDYLLKFVNPDGTNYTMLGVSPCYLNSTSNGSTIFVLGLTGNNNDHINGQDLDNGAVWTLISQSDGTFKLKNKGTNKFLNGTSSIDDEAAAAKWSLCSLGSGYDVSVSCNDGSKGTAYFTIAGDDTHYTSKAVATNTSVTFHAASNAANIIFTGWGGDGSGRYNASTTLEVTKTTSFVANFADGIHISCTVEPTGAATPDVYQTGHSEWKLPSDGYVAPNQATTFSIKDLKAGYGWLGWYDNSGNLLQSTTGPYNAGNVSSEKIVIAKFELIGYPVTFNTNNASYGTVKAYLNGQEINSGDVVPAGSVVTFTATPEAGYLFWRWTWGNNQHEYNIKSFDRTINEECNITAEFQEGIHVSAYTNDANLGTVIIEKDGKSGTVFHTTTYPGIYTFKATEVGRGVFTGWYNNVDCIDEHRVSTDLTYNTPEGNQDGGIKETDYNLWANFVSGYQVNVNVSPSGLQPEITIHQRDHVDWKITNHDYVASGTTAVISVGDVAGYTFDGWYNGGVKVSDAPQANYNLGGVTADVNLIAKFRKASTVSSVAADFTDRGHGNGGFTTTDGVTSFSPTNGSWNWASLFVFDAAGAGTERNVPADKTAADYSGFSITTKGDAYRIWIDYRDTNKTIEIPASTEETTHRFEWSDFPEITDVSTIKRINIAGPYNTTGTTTYISCAYLYKDVTETLDFTSVGNTKGSNATWTVEGNNAILQSSGTSDNMKYIYDFTSGGNMEGHSATEFTGIRVHSTGDRFRLIIYVDNGVDGEGKTQYKRFVGYVTNTGTGTDPKTQHFQWKDLQEQWGTTHMTDADVAKIKFIAVGGDDAGSGNGRIVLQNVWLDNIKDYDHTFVCYGEEGAKVTNHGVSGYTYDYSLNGSVAAVQLTNGGGRDADGCIKLSAGNKVTITSPSANSYFTTLKIIFADGSVETPSIGETVHEYVYTNNTSETKYISKIEYSITLASHSKSHTITSSSESRDYWLYVPASIVASESGTYPVVFSLHGTSNDYYPTDGGVQNYNDIADKENFIVVYPRGRMLEFPKFGSGQLRGWEATGEDNKDVQFMRDIIKDLKENPTLLENDKTLTAKIDESEIYMTGFSNGGMMTYAMANADPDVFAAYASISGYPINEMHHRTHNTHPVPFLHIHGTKDDFVRYDLVPTIVDNMLTRNGLPYTPTNTVNNGNAKVYGAATKYNMYEYTATGCKPFIYYTVGTGSNASDTGLGHNKECEINSVDSKQIIWNFFRGKTLDKTESDTEFKANVSLAKVAGTGQEQSLREDANQLARDHGWKVSDGGRLLAQYGESGGYSTTGQNVYHTIQLKDGDHYIKFNATSTNDNNYVIVRVAKLGDITPFNTMNAPNFSISDETIMEKAYYTKGEICMKFVTSGIGEYMISFTKGKQDDNTKIENVEISKTGTETTTNEYQGGLVEDFTGYYNYNNRLFAQWNFDLCDGYRFNGLKIKSYLDDSDSSNDAWEADLTNTNFIAGRQDATNGTIIYTYTKPLGTQISGEEPTEFYANEDNFDQLTYNGTDEIIPVTAGLKFNAPAGHVKVYIDIANGQTTSTHLVVDQYVKLLVPYITNSYRNDLGSADQPNETNKTDFTHCMHHIKRDILYIALNQGTVWTRWKELAWNDKGEPTSWRKTEGHVKNACINDPSQELFSDGGTEHVNDKNYFKMDYRGYANVPCVMQFTDHTIIDRIGVNRNLTYSFYTEYINELGMQKPSVRQRIVGSPKGLKVANIGSTDANYTNAVAFTYGGWKDKNGYSYKSYDDQSVTDDWTSIGVYGADGKHYTWETIPTPKATDNVPIAIDGFPVATQSSIFATSEKLMPSTTTGNLYHPADRGTFSITSYVENVTPWNLPCRGAYGKFEVSYPGVLNADVIMTGGKKYYIADEFGKPITQNVFSRTASGVSVNYDSGSKSFSVSSTDYVKLSFNAYPGKTYYIFSNEAGLGVSGFYYEPFVYRPDGGTEFERVDVGYDEIELFDDVNFNTSMGSKSWTPDQTIYSPKQGGGTVPYTIKYSKDAVKVTLNRSFNKNTWNSICLPYSINQAQLENVFGVGTEVILLRDIRKAGTPDYNNTTMNWITHVNQDIIAGYPYLIRPTNNVSKVETYACLSDGQRADSPIGDISGNSGGDQSLYIPGFAFTGTYNKIDGGITYGSYYMSGGKLARITESGKTITIKGYRAWVKYTEPQTGAGAKINKALIDDIEEIEIEETTGIEEVKTDDVRVKANNVIYNINGQVVSHDISDFRNLPKGIYIINGRKYIAK